MILGTMTVYQCDSVACDTTAFVAVEREESFRETWHLGHTHHFCPEHKGLLANAAAILEDDEIQRRFEKADVLNFRPSGSSIAITEPVTHNGGSHAA